MVSHDILNFWFGSWPYDANAASKIKAQWFNSTAEFDLAITTNFESRITEALAKETWPHQSIEDTLATIILLDQFPRNIYRGTEKAFAGDQSALALTLKLVEHHQHLELPLEPCIFACLPLQHSEDLAIQEQSLVVHDGILRHYGSIASNYVDYAKLHHDIISRFGRFPHRNKALGRESTSEERQYLEDGGMRFGQ